MLVPVILSGGSGSRLWPVSRHLFPKQFHELTGPATLLQQTITRARQVASNDNVMVICNEDHRFLVSDQLMNSGTREVEIVLEPKALNTAPAITVAALYSQQLYGVVTLLILPSDHLITSDEQFCKVTEIAAQNAAQGMLVTFGIVPDQPETGYGYIQRGKALNGDCGFQVSRFVEKPTQAVAESLVQSGDYYWNSGMFVFRNDVYLDEIKKWRPEIYRRCVEATENITRDEKFARIDPVPFAKCQHDSIDYAVMENTKRAVVVPLATTWSDVGSWSQLKKIMRSDEEGNVTHGDVIIRDVKNSYIRAEQRLVAAIGIDNVIIVETDDAVLVADKSSDQDVKAIVQELTDHNRTEAMCHTKVYRPWGCFQTLDSGNGFQVKRLVINPGASISLQLHRQRSEHWVVVSGIANVTCGDETLILKPNESTYIPVGTKHKLENLAEVPLEVVEVQTGSYLGEDDIIRFEDEYGRV
jgi:mannose-1-phosphate guanylyltransferase/mannose-6-phosphate isomerase